MLTIVDKNRLSNNFAATCDSDLECSGARARAKIIQTLSQCNGDFDSILLEVYSCYTSARQWENLSSTDHIILECKWTKSILKLLAIGNVEVMRSIRYRLREQTQEENELGWWMDN